MTQLPEPPAEGVLKWAIENPEAPRDTVRAVNKLLAVRVVIITGGVSSFLVGENEAVLTISTKDINLGTVTGSRAGNAALGSLIDALARTFTLGNGTS